MQGIGAHYELVVSCRGDVDPTLGYLINIKDIDAAVRAHTVPLIHQAIGFGTTSSPPANPVRLLPSLFARLPLRSLHSLRWNLSPYYSLEVTSASPSTVLLRQKFDFCAAHRLHSPALSPEDNRRFFGKCNLPGGHGHNYQFEPCIAITLDGDARPFTLSDLERLADDLIVQRFDHKNLNADTQEFRDATPDAPGGLNPSVENIAKVCYTILAPAIQRPGASLMSVTVWESDRTSCTYPG